MESVLTCDAVKAIIEQALPGASATVQNFGRGTDHFEAVVVSPQFEGLSLVKQHQLVYAPVQEHLQSGAMHALGLKTYTPAQWAELQQAAAD